VAPGLDQRYSDAVAPLYKILYSWTVKEVRFVGRALDVLREFPD
jgi:hypothetical protein